MKTQTAPGLVIIFKLPEGHEANAQRKVEIGQQLPPWITPIFVEGNVVTEVVQAPPFFVGVSRTEDQPVPGAFARPAGCECPPFTMAHEKGCKGVTQSPESASGETTAREVPQDMSPEQLESLARWANREAMRIAGTTDTAHSWAMRDEDLQRVSTLMQIASSAWQSAAHLRAVLLRPSYR